MKVIPPITIDDTNLTSNVALDDGVEYSAAATYALADVVIETIGTDATFHAFESLVASNTGNALTDSSKWLDLGPVNRLRMFDQAVGTVTTAASIDVTVEASSVCNGLALLNLDAQQVQVTVSNGAGTLYDETYALRSTVGINDWYSWFTQEVEFDTELILVDLPPIANTDVRVQITTAGAEVSCGTMVLGRIREIGLQASYGARGGIIDYSRKTTDDFGNTTLTERAYSKRHTFRHMVPAAAVDGAFRRIAGYRATPVIWIGTDDYQMTWIYGWPRDWGIEIAYPSHSILSLEIEGLT